MKIKKRTFGVLSNGEKASLFTIYNGEMSFSVTNYGCCITSVLLGRQNPVDAVLGYSTLEGYIKNPCHFGALIGRYANRIAGASFSLDGKEYPLTDNDSGNCLHGGKPGWHKLLWEADIFKKQNEAGVVFARLSPAGEQGFPGNCSVRVMYSLTVDNEIVLRYYVRSDAPTPVNLTNHTYFNLAGEDSGSILDHSLQIFADSYTPVDSAAIPTGGAAAVEGTPFDFRSPKRIGDEIDAVPGGYDHNWVVRQTDVRVNPVAVLRDNVSGRTLSVSSTQPGVQFYAGNFIDNEHGKNGFVYTKRSGLCLETQHFPDSPHNADFPDCILRPGEPYRQKTIWKFGF